VSRVVFAPAEVLVTALNKESAMNRRRFLQAAVAGSAFATLAADAPEPRLKKAVKFGMIRIDGSIADKFALIKSLGFQGVEMDSPSAIDRDEAVKARDQTGIVIHGVVDSIHWKMRLSDPDPEVRARGLAGLKTAIEDCKFYGGDTVLLVPGRVADPQRENFEQVWERSQAEVRKALPLAERLGVIIAIETVWNDFITTPEQLVKYVDEFNSPHVAAYFDISNMLKYGVKPGDWIRKLGKRMVKFDFKGYSHTKKWVPIGEGDEDWPDVLKALDEVGYRGWATAEVAGGGPNELRDVAERMNRVLGLR
jgi:hexulose-6-phosphate isomerase